MSRFEHRPELPPVELNPYAPPATPIDSVTNDTLDDPDSARRANLGWENSVKLAAAFCYGCAVLILSLSTLRTLASPFERGTDQPAAGLMGQIIGGLLVACLPIALGNGLKSLKPWARWTAVCLLPFGVLCSVPWVVLGLRQGVPALVIGGAMFALCSLAGFFSLLVPGTSAIFTAQYREAVAATPHIRPWASNLINILSYMFLFIAAGAFVTVLVTRL